VGENRTRVGRKKKGENGNEQYGEEWFQKKRGTHLGIFKITVGVDKRESNKKKRGCLRWAEGKEKTTVVRKEKYEKLYRGGH